MRAQQVVPVLASCVDDEEETKGEIEEELLEIVAVEVLLDKLQVFEPQIDEVSALLNVSCVVEANGRSDELLLLELIFRNIGFEDLFFAIGRELCRFKL